MRRWIGILFCCSFLSILSAQNNRLVKYQYWFDTSQAGNTTRELSKVEEVLTLSIDAAQLVDGLHTLYFRFGDEGGSWSKLDSWLFVKLRAEDTGNKVAACEYWIDNDYEGRILKEINSEEIGFTVDAATLREGLHTLNYRVKDSRGQWSKLNSWIFLKSRVTDTENKVVSYEYWVDDDYAGRTMKAVTEAEMTFVIDASTLKDGIHTLNYRAKDAHGQWSKLDAWIFVKQQSALAEAKVAWYQYWWNEHLEAAQKISITPSELYVLEDQLSVPDQIKNEKAMGSGTARFSILFGNEQGKVSALHVSEIKDGVPPVSRMNSLPTEERDSILTISWSGTDDWSGVKDYTVYISENGEDFKPWITNTSEVSATYRCYESDYSVSFFVVARDSLDNVEQMKVEAEASVKFMYIDSIPPVSAIDKIPAIVYDKSIQVRWSGRDDVHEVKDYTIYVSEDGHPFTPWIEKTVETSAVYSGKFNSTYRFVSVARDTKDNIEELDETRAVSVFFTEFASLSMTFKDQNGKPLEGVEVILRQGAKEYDFLTGSDGAVNQGEMSIGDWQVSTWKAGYVSVNRSLNLTGGQNNSSFELTLGWSERRITQNQTWGQRGPQPFAGFYEFDDLTLDENVVISSSGISHLVVYVKGTLRIGKNAAIRVRNGYYPTAPTIGINQIEETNIASYGIEYKKIYLLPEVYGKGGDGGDGSDGTIGRSQYMHAGYDVYYWLDGGGGSGGGGGAGGYGGGIGGRGGQGKNNLRTGKYQGPNGRSGNDNGGNGGYAGANSIVYRGGGATGVGESRKMADDLNPGGGAGGGGNGGDGGSGGMVDTGILAMVSGVSGNGGGGGGYGGGVLTIVAKRIICESEDAPAFLVSGQCGGRGINNSYTTSQSGENGEGGLLIIHTSEYESSSMHWSLGNDRFDRSDGLGALTGNPQKVLLLGLPEDFETSISGTEANGIHVYGLVGKIVFENAVVGKHFMIVDTTGIVRYDSSFEQDRIEISLPKGLYVVHMMGKSYKVLVK